MVEDRVPSTSERRLHSVNRWITRTPMKPKRQFRSPSELVDAFLLDYREWNDRVFALSESGEMTESAVMALAQALYQQTILSVYCRVGFAGEPIAFGNDAAHDPNREVIVSESLCGDGAIIHTQHHDRLGFVADYEYRLSRHQLHWYLEAVDYFDDHGKYPSL
ncbi:hypothetical protein VIBNIMADA3021_p0014 [Vibrio nigripulchritudo MADA3021]|nr:hypothetical protein VIBNIMADA3021_p0014 [Vibrio nigripulchritudo MADA3021]